MTFAPGKISVIVRRGDEEATDEVVTAGEKARIELSDVTPDCKNPKIRIINVSMVDEKGIVIPDCDDHIYVDMLGTTVLGIANGNPNGTQPNIAYDIKLFHGRAQIIVTAESKAVTVRCNGFAGATV